LRDFEVHKAVGIITGALLLIFATASPSVAQRAAAALERGDAAQDLASHAVACMKRGEDALSPEAKLAAYREGLGLAKRALAIDDQNADAHFALFATEGRIMLLEGVTPNPISLLKVNQELERCLQLNPNHSDALAAKGGLYRQLPWVLGGNLDKAEECLKRAIEIDPNAVGARIELARTYRDKGRTELCEPLLTKAAELAQRMNKERQLGEARQLLTELHR
jgi:tetratricopeptide (TPR) repeat protein